MRGVLALWLMSRSFLGLHLEAFWPPQKPSLVTLTVTPCSLPVLRAVPQLTQKKTNMQFKTLDSTLQTINKETNAKEAVTYRCADIDKMVPSLMGVSKVQLGKARGLDGSWGRISGLGFSRLGAGAVGKQTNAEDRSEKGKGVGFDETGCWRCVWGVCLSPCPRSSKGLAYLTPACVAPTLQAVLENVIFVHQEESNWPLSEGRWALVSPTRKQWLWSPMAFCRRAG